MPTTPDDCRTDGQAQSRHERGTTDCRSPHLYQPDALTYKRRLHAEAPAMLEALKRYETAFIIEQQIGDGLLKRDEHTMTFKDVRPDARAIIDRIEGGTK